MATTTGEAKASLFPIQSYYHMLLSFFCTMFLLTYIRFDLQMVTMMMTVVDSKFSQQLPHHQPEEEEDEQDTAIIITSSWIPSHPSTFLIDSVLNSTRRHLVGLASSAPIFLTVDPIPTSTTPIEDKVEKLEQYIIKLYQKHLIHPHVHILPSVQHLHIGGSVMKALQLIELHYPNVHYVYSLQHDFPFSRDVDHVALWTVMETHPDKVNWIRFPKRDPNTLQPGCGSKETIWYNKTFTAMTPTMTLPMDSTIMIATNDTVDGGASIASSNREPVQLQLIPTSSYSNNNHLARLAWYKETLASLAMLTRPPEFPLQVRANTACQEDKSIGLYLYHEVCLEHLDGRHSIQVDG